MKPESIDEYTVEAIIKYTELIGENYFNQKKGEGFGKLFPAASLNEKVELILENKPTNIFKILDLPIVSAFLTKHVDTANKILFKKDIALYNSIHIDMDKAKNLFGNSKIDEAFIKNFFEDRSIIKSLIGVDLADFF